MRCPDFIQIATSAMLVALAASAHVDAQVPENERQALIEFYQATGGDDWLTNDGWLGPEGTECDWFGLSCFTFFSGVTRIIGVNLSGNNLHGTLPESIGELGFLTTLDISENRLAGSVPRGITRLTRLSDTPRLDFRGLRLCWNDLFAPDEEVREFVSARHFSQNFELCQGRQRVELNERFSGTWLSPARQGEFLSLMQLDRGAFVSFLFTFDPQGGQRWRLGVVEDPEAEPGIRIDPMFESRGRFAAGFDPSGVNGQIFDRGFMELDGLADGDMVVLNGSRQIFHFRFFRTLETVSAARFEYRPLTRIAGTRCDNFSPRQWMSGLWFDPERDGEGILVEILDDDRALVFWWTHQPDGGGAQAWMFGVGRFSDTARNTLIVDDVYQPVGARYGDDEFDSSDLRQEPWGSLSLRFFDDDNAQLGWESSGVEYGTGQFPLVRLARPKLVDCLEE